MVWSLKRKPNIVFSTGTIRGLNGYDCVDRTACSGVSSDESSPGKPPSSRRSMVAIDGFNRSTFFGKHLVESPALSAVQPELLVI